MSLLNEEREKAVQMLFSDNEDEELETMLAIYELIDCYWFFTTKNYVSVF